MLGKNLIYPDGKAPGDPILLKKKSQNFNKFNISKIKNFYIQFFPKYKTAQNNSSHLKRKSPKRSKKEKVFQRTLKAKRSA